MRLSIGDQSKPMQNKSKSEYRTLCKWFATAFIVFDIIWMPKKEREVSNIDRFAIDLRSDEKY